MLAQPRHALLAAALLAPGAAAQCPLVYEPALHTSTLVQVERPVVGDFDADGRNDLAVVPSASAQGLHLHWGLGDGTFEPPAFVFPAARTAIGSGDFNGDGVPDIVCSQPGTPPTLQVLLSGPGRTFTAGAPAPFSIATFFTEIAVGDYDGDGFLDVAALNADNPRTLHLARGDGTGNLTPGSSTPIIPPPNQAVINLAPARIDATPRDELIVTMGDLNASRVLVGRLVDWASPPDFFDRHDLAIGHTRIAVADLNADGRADLVIPFRLPNNAAGVAVLSGAESGALEGPRSYFAGSNIPLAVAAADLDGDGDVDVVTTRPTFRVWTNDGTGALTPTLFDYAPVGTLSAAAADFNRDGRIDLAFTTTIGAPTIDVVPNTGPTAPIAAVLDPIYTCPNGAVEVSVRIPRMPNPPVSWEYLGERGWTPIVEEQPFQTRDGESFGVPSSSNTTTLEVRVDPACCSGSRTAQVRCLVTNPCGTTIGPPIRLVICRPDFTCDGFLDFFDYDGFVDAYLSGAPDADFNADGFLDFFDYDDFVAAFETGC